jgi:uncharacterized membrane protein YoaK (UPF0700 family)
MRNRLRQPLPGHPKALLAVAMAWAAGFVDAVGWLVLYRVYTSHMTGNTASFAGEIAGREWQDAWHHGWVIIPFFAGLLYSAATTKAARRHGFHSSFAVALITELLLLSAFIAAGFHWLHNGHLIMRSGVAGYLLLSLPAAAMGVQTVTVTRINGLRVYTTYLTGSIAKCSEALVDYGFWFYDRTHGHSRRRFVSALRISLRQRSVQHALLTAGLWIGFFSGALCGVLAERRFSLLALCAPVAVIAAAAVVDLVLPVAAADEPEIGDSAH